MISLPTERVLTSGYKSIEHLGGYDELEQGAALLEAIRLTKANGAYNCPTLDRDQIAFDQLYPVAYKNRLTYPVLPQQYADRWEKDYAAAVEQVGGAIKVIADRDKYRPAFEKKKRILKLLAAQGCSLLIGGDATGFFQFSTRTR